MKDSSSYTDKPMTDKTALLESLRLMAWTQRFGLGTLWWVGENLWVARLPSGGPNPYFRRNDRHNHPGMCVSTSNDALHAAVPMWYGSHSTKKGGTYFSVYLDGSEKAPTYFGSFHAVQIDCDLFGEMPGARALKQHRPSKKEIRVQERFQEDHVVPYDNKPRLNQAEVAALKQYIKVNMSLVGVVV